MAIAYDTFSNVAAGTGDLSWTHTPVGTPRGVLVYIITNATTDQVTSVTYGGVTMTEVTNSPLIKSTGETGAVHAFFLGIGIPSGAQTVYVTVSSSTNKRAGCYTVTAARSTKVQDTKTISSDSVANPSVTLSLSGISSFCSIGFASGQDLTSGISPTIGWTGSLEDSVISYTRGWYKYDTITSSDRASGWTQTAEDATGLAVAIAEDDSNCEVNVNDPGYGKDGLSNGLNVDLSFDVSVIENPHCSDIDSVADPVVPFYWLEVSDPTIDFSKLTSDLIYGRDGLSYGLDILIPEYLVDIYDNVFIREDITFFQPEYSINVEEFAYSYETSFPIPASLISVEVSDPNIYFLENVTARDILEYVFIPEYLVNLFDYIFVSEDTAFDKQIEIDLSDSARTTESVTVLIPEYLISVSDIIEGEEGIIEGLTVLIPFYNLDVYDDAYTDSDKYTTVIVPEYLIDTFEPARTTESVTALIPEYLINVSDLGYGREDITFFVLDYFVNVYDDAYTDSDKYTTVIVPEYLINVSEFAYGIETDEFLPTLLLTVLIPFNVIEPVDWAGAKDVLEYLFIPEYIVNLSDNVFISEDINFDKEIQIDIFDPARTTESVTAFILEYFINLFNESAFTSDVPDFLVELEIFTWENTISEEGLVNLLIPEFFVSVSDTSSVAELISFEKEYFIILDDTVYSREDITLLIPDYFINLFNESVFISEDISISVDYLIIIWDDLTARDILEYVFIPEYSISVADSSALLEYILILNTELGIIDTSDIIFASEDVSISVGVPSGWGNYIYSLTTVEEIDGTSLTYIEEVIGV